MIKIKNILINYTPFRGNLQVFYFLSTVVKVKSKGKSVTFSRDAFAFFMLQLNGRLSFLFCQEKITPTSSYQLCVGKNIFTHILHFYYITDKNNFQ